MYQKLQFLYTMKKISLIKVTEFSYITKCIALIQDVPCKTQHKDKGTSNINRVAQFSWLTVAL